MPTNYTLQVCSVAEEGRLIVEIWLADELFAEVSGPPETANIRLYPPASKASWDIDLRALETMIEKAKAEL